jgi:hypothetical protein
LKTLIFRTAIIIFSLFPLYGCTNNGLSSEERVFKQIPELQEISPHKPVKIKLKRNAQGEYYWDLSGNDADKIIEADKKLREALGK